MDQSKFPVAHAMGSFEGINYRKGCSPSFSPLPELPSVLTDLQKDYLQSRQIPSIGVISGILELKLLSKGKAKLITEIKPSSMNQIPPLALSHDSPVSDLQHCIS